MQNIKYILTTFLFSLCFAFIPWSLSGMVTPSLQKTRQLLRRHFTKPLTKKQRELIREISKSKPIASEKADTEQLEQKQPVMPMDFFDQLIKDFEYFDSLPSPSEDVLEAKRNLSQKIAGIGLQMDIESLMKHKKSLLKLDPNASGVESLFEKLNATYMQLTDKDGNITYLPEHIVRMSQTLRDMLEDLGGRIPEISIPFLQYSSTILQKVRDIIDKKIALDNYSLNELEELIEISNCINHLGLDIQIQLLIVNKIYSLCKPLEWSEIPKLLEQLYSPVFKNIIVQRFRNKIIEAVINDYSKITYLDNPYNHYIQINTVTPSTNQKMIAVGYGVTDPVIFGHANGFYVYSLNEDGSIKSKEGPQTIDTKNVPVTHLEFSPDSKILIVGGQSDENNLLLFTIDDGKIKNDPTILKGHASPINGIAFHPHGKVMISTAEDTICLRNIDQIKDFSYLNPMDIKKIKRLCFNSDGTLLAAIGGKEEKENCVIVWKFNQDGTLKQENPIVHIVNEMTQVNDIAWLPNSTKCFIAGIPQENQRKGLMLCDISEIGITNCKMQREEQKYSFVKVSPDGTIMFAGNTFLENRFISLFSIYNKELIVLNFSTKGITHRPAFSSDFHRIFYFLNSRGNNSAGIIQTLVTNEEKAILQQCMKLDAYQLLCIDKVLDGVRDDALDIHLEQTLKIPNNIIALLEKLPRLEIKPPVKSIFPKPQEKAPKKEDIGVMATLSKLWNLAKAYWPSSQQ